SIFRICLSAIPKCVASLLASVDLPEPANPVIATITFGFSASSFSIRDNSSSNTVHTSMPLESFWCNNVPFFKFDALVLVGTMWANMEQWHTSKYFTQGEIDLALETAVHATQDVSDELRSNFG